MVIRAKQTGGRDAQLRYRQICLQSSEKVPSPRKAGRGLGRGGPMVEPPLHDPPIEQGASSPQPSPPQVCGGERVDRLRCCPLLHKCVEEREIDGMCGFMGSMGDFSGNSLPALQGEGIALKN